MKKEQPQKDKQILDFDSENDLQLVNPIYCAKCMTPIKVIIGLTVNGRPLLLCETCNRLQLLDVKVVENNNKAKKTKPTYID